jgi:hypothetical protein
LRFTTVRLEAVLNDFVVKAVSTVDDSSSWVYF